MFPKMFLETGDILNLYHETPEGQKEAQIAESFLLVGGRMLAASSTFDELEVALVGTAYEGALPTVLGIEPGVRVRGTARVSDAQGEITLDINFAQARSRENLEAQVQDIVGKGHFVDRLKQTRPEIFMELDCAIHEHCSKNRSHPSPCLRDSVRDLFSDRTEP